VLLQKSSLSLIATVLAVGLAGFATLANANTNIKKAKSMSGQWYQNRGPLVDIPINGGPAGCGGGAPAGCVANLVPVGGGIPGSGTVLIPTSPPAPKPFTVPKAVFQQNAGPQTVAVAVVPTVVQLGSTFAFSGPGTSGMLGPITAFPTAGGRAAKTFAWCPGVGGPGCALPGSATPATYNGRVRYSNPGTAFGGTMAMMQNGNFTVSVTIGTSMGTTLLLHQPGGAAAFAPQHPGRGYAVTDTDMLNGGPIRFGFMTNFPCTGGALPPAPPGCGQIASSGPQIGTGPPDANLNWGFPWTTGMVTASNTGTNGGAAATTTLVATGTDMRDANGNGNITLVAGGTTQRFGAATMNPQQFAALDVVTMLIGAREAPGLSPIGLMTGVSLLLLAGGFALRRRL